MISVLTGSLSRGEYWATCLRVLCHDVSAVWTDQYMAIHLLLGNALYRCLVVETEVTGVNDVVSLCVARKLIELAQVSCICNELPILCASTLLLSYL